MRLIICQRIYIVNKEVLNIWNSYRDFYPYKYEAIYNIKKTIDNPMFIPRVGEMIESSLWSSKDNPQKVIEVTYDYDEDICYVDLPHYCFFEETPFGKEFEKCINGHGWML